MPDQVLQVLLYFAAGILWLLIVDTDTSRRIAEPLLRRYRRWRRIRENRRRHRVLDHYLGTRKR